MTPRPSLVQRLQRAGVLCENILLVGLLLLMVGLASMQIIQRNLMGSGFVWTDELLRIMVLWLGLIGAVAASREDKQITIDVLARVLPPKLKLAARLVVDAFTTFICVLVAWHGGRFVQMEMEFESTVLGGLPAWIFQGIIPLCFGLIAYRYALFFFIHARELFFSTHTKGTK